MTRAHTLDQYKERANEVHLFIDTHSRFPRNREAPAEERSLGHWWTVQKKQAREGTLDEDRLRIFESISARRTKTPKWTARVEELQDFYAEHDRLPKSSIESEFSLATWVIGQRMKLKAGKLPAEQEKLMRKIPGALETRSHTPTDSALKTLQEWCESHGTLPRTVPSTKKPWSDEQKEESRIANWMRNHAREGIHVNETAEVVARRDAIKKLYEVYPRPSVAKRTLKEERQSA